MATEAQTKVTNFKLIGAQVYKEYFSTTFLLANLTQN